MNAKRISLIALALLVISFIAPAYAGAQPPKLPHAFYGTLQINGIGAPVGTVVEAKGTGVTPGEDNPIVTTEAGKYGQAGLGPKLVVQGNIASGAIITFYVNGVSTGQTAAWQSGETAELNLAVTIAVAPPTVSTSAATAIGTTTATLNGNLTALGTATSVQVSFEWGLTAAYGNQTTPQTMTIGSFSAPLSTLSSGTTYHFRAKAVGQGTSYGTDMTFITATPAAGGGGGGGDTTLPIISDISVSNITKTSADISWKTNEMSDSQVDWSSPSKLSPLDTARVTYHLVHLTDLTPGTTYHYKTMSRDAAGNLAVSSEHTFTTLPGAAAFAASKLSISPGEVYIGETVAIRVLVTNTGDGAGSYKVVLKINGVVEATKDITLNAGASGEVTFSTAKNVAGSYSVGVDGLSGSFTVKEKPVPPAPAAFSLSNLSVQPTGVQPNQTVTVSVSVANTGGTEGSYTVVLKINGVMEAEKRVTVAAGKSQAVSFSVTREKPGSYTVTADGLSGSFTVAEVAPVKPPLNWPLIGGIIAAVIVVGLVIIFFLLKRER